ncbi:MAG TPA: PP2C family protein-serine/threonine phosphatase [Chloroflexota bacterium]|nr:PP2C family protein-serine/threonine phosphatase [Chloroflexota bacterium]
MLEVAVAKLSKYAVRESGDTVEVTERPHGGISVVLADGQGSGRNAKTMSNLVAKKAINLLADGTRDGATARAVHDFLFAYRHGQVSAELAIVSADLLARTLVISRNTHCPALVVRNGEVELWAEPSNPIGLYAHTKPAIVQVPLAAGALAVVYSDGVHDAGARKLKRLDALAVIQPLVGQPAQTIADRLLAAALEADEGRAADDMSVAVMATRPADHSDGARRMKMELPLG